MKYDEKLVRVVIQKFRSKAYKHTEVTIYFDLDNTLCLFSPFGRVQQSIKAMYNKGFFLDLPCFPEAPYVLSNLKSMGYNTKILSTCINSPYCKQEKKAWVNHYLNFIPDKDILLIPEGAKKTQYITNPQSSILVDDYFSNIQDIYTVGGVGVKKTFSGKQRPVPQVENLVDIFQVLEYLNCL